MNVMKTVAPLCALMMTSPGVASHVMERIQVGKFASRAIWIPAAGIMDHASNRRPSIVLVPGSGAQGPEEMMPGVLTEDGNDHGLFLQMADAFAASGWNVLCLGKPGVEFFTEFNIGRWFYDQNLYRQTTWPNLIENLGEGVNFLRAQPAVDPEKIYVLGHSEGTRIAVDYATKDTGLKGLILLGYSGEDIKTTVDWQLYRRPIEYLFATDVDTNRDQMISRHELSQWPIDVITNTIDGTLDFGGKDELSFDEIEAQLRALPILHQIYEKLRNSTLYSGGQFNIGPIYQKTAALPMPVYIFTGAIDLQTRPEEAVAAGHFCEKMGKTDCYVQLVPGLGHGFSPPRGPRRHPLVDITVGPIAQSFLNTLGQLAMSLEN